MCQKVPFTKVEAQSALNLNHRRHRRSFIKEVRKYYCAECNCWHLTSQHDEDRMESPVKLIEENRWMKLLKHE